jgi:glucosamine kinase
VYYLGIDGGATTCRARLTDARGRILGEGSAGASNLTLGVEIAAAAILAASDEAITAAGIGNHGRALTRAGLGLAGANVPSLAAAIGAVRFPFAATTIASDAVAACLGAHGGGDGAILIVGTGSQGLAIVRGRATSIGGWGFALSDEASGAILGRAAIRAAIAAADGLATASPLSQILLDHLGGDPATAVGWALSARPRDYAAVVPMILECAGRGDPLATHLLSDAVNAATGLIDRLIALGATRVALMGGLAATYRSRLPERLSDAIVEPLGDALDGALALARSGVPL